MLLGFEWMVDLTEESVPTLTEIGNGLVQGQFTFRATLPPYGLSLASWVGTELRSAFTTGFGMTV